MNTAEPPDTDDIPEWKVENDYSHYRPLDHSKKEIRLVTIAPGLFDEPLRCTLTRHELSEAGLEFESLSYCWGDLKDTTDITLRHDYSGHADSIHDRGKPAEQSFEVTKSLDLALRHLRHEDGARVIWIDALCINQGSIRERNYAISFMVDLYRLASRVVISLGKEGKGEHFQGMWDLMDMLSSALERKEAKPLWQHPDLDRAIDEIRFVPKGDSVTPDTSILDMHLSLIFEAFFGYPWFHRVWVVQEAINAKQAVVQCGKQERDWLDILVMLCWAVKSSRSYVGGWTGSFPSDKLPPFLWARLQAARHGETDAPARLPLLDIVSRGRAFSATDPRDKVFALLSFGEETHDFGELPPRLKPDYGKTSSDVWKDLTRQWIIDHKSLDILAIQREKIDKNNQIAEDTVFITDPESSNSHSPVITENPPVGHPSWALWHKEHPKSAQTALFRATKELWNSSLPLDLPLLDQPRDPSTLSLPGMLIDVVKSVQWPFKRWTYADDDMRIFNWNMTPPKSVEAGVPVAWGALIGAVAGLGDDETTEITFRAGAEISIPSYPNGTSLLQAFIETLVCRRFGQTYFGPGISMSLEPEDAEAVTDSQRAELEVIAHFAAHWAKSRDPDMKWLPEVLAKELKPLIPHGSSRKFTELCEYAEGRCFFQIGRGGFGLCPQSTHVGDVVVSLAGSSTPFMLRPLGAVSERASEFSLVGECFVHDLDIRRTTQAFLDKGEELDIFHIV
ncbi:heterokaryon incompatibility protein-domain-containing protein [Xylariales sp. AK1849]|nr:heterokaryon incompatibility protein-domain-containing protein [Xylariales sp. AK1849]